MSSTDLDRPPTTTTVLGWIGLLLAGVFCGIVALVADMLILWDHSTGCEPGPADPDQVFAGQLSMAVVLVVVTASWVLWLFGLSRHRTAVVVSALLAITPAAGYFVYGLDAGSWVGGFCIPF